MESISVLTLTQTAASDVNAARFIDFNGEHTGAAKNALGVSRSDISAGAAIPIDVIGTTIVMASGAISVGDAVEVGEQGKATKHASGIKQGYALSAAAKNRDLIEVLLINQ